MKHSLLIPVILLAASIQLAAQDNPAQDATPPPESPREFRYSLSVIDDATLYSNLQVPIPKLHNQLLIEPTVILRYKPRWSFSTSVIGVADRYTDTFTQDRK